MYNKKYYLERLEEFGQHNIIYDDIEGSICYLAYLNVGERGWFLYEISDWFDSAHRIHTSIIKSVEYFNDKIVVETQNTRFTFRLING